MSAQCHPTDTRHWPKVVSVLAHRLRRWPNTDTTMGLWLVCWHSVIIPDSEQMLGWYWSTVYDAGLTLTHYWVIIFYLLAVSCCVCPESIRVFLSESLRCTSILSLNPSNVRFFYLWNWTHPIQCNVISLLLLSIWKWWLAIWYWANNKTALVQLFLYL